jgi:hypothetical protein
VQKTEAAIKGAVIQLKNKIGHKAYALVFWETS